MPRKNFFVDLEEKVLAFWQENKTFEQSLKKPSPRGDYVFYDGPPFATGLPHYGHIVASLMKDAVPRYWTMRGYYVERRWGWDCHGLPIENIVEKEMGSQKKKDIEKMGVEKFNELCRSKVLSYGEDWKKVITRLGRWVDMDNAYKTMDLDFMESVWWVFKELWQKGLIYQDYRSMHICPRCETTLSQSEVTEGYKNIKDLSCVVKFPVKGEDNLFFLAWTTTPWTLLANVALAVKDDLKYIQIKTEDKERFILAADRQEDILGEKKFVIEKEFLGKDLVGKEYQPPFPFYWQKEDLAQKENGWKVYAADFVTAEEGTGIVHIAPAFGEDDLQLGKKYSLPFVQHVGLDGVFKEEVGEFAGLNAKPAGDHQATDRLLVNYLKEKGLLFQEQEYEHSYPHCWRCDTPLLNYATSSWFVKVTALKPEMLKQAEKIYWFPQHIKKGRFGKWLEGARDWSISRQRFWASVIPIWECEKCGEKKVIGSVKELEELGQEKVTDLHKHIVDKITFSCPKCGGTMRRIPDVLDCWFESGSMPYAQKHYPFENKEKFEKNFPAHFIAEGQDQCRAWFYYLHTIAVGLKDKPAFQNVIVNGIVLAEDGKKMSKKLKNYPDPREILDTYGADALRFYLLSSPVVMAENLNFSAEGVQEALRKVILVLWNTLRFAELFPAQKTEFSLDNLTVLEQWILARFNSLREEVMARMEEYNLAAAVRSLENFVNDLSTWFLRRSRERLKEDQGASRAVFAFILRETAKIFAPFLPFLAELVWQRVTGYNFQQGNKSVHLEDWPEALALPFSAEKVLAEMQQTRQAVELALAARDQAKIKVRQPLPRLTIWLPTPLSSDCQELVKEEVNVKEIEMQKAEKIKVDLDTEITPELRQEGLAREAVRLANGLRKKLGLTVEDKIIIFWQSQSPEAKEAFSRFAAEIKKGALAEEIKQGRADEVAAERETKGDFGFWLGIKKIS